MQPFVRRVAPALLDDAFIWRAHLAEGSGFNPLSDQAV